MSNERVDVLGMLDDPTLCLVARIAEARAAVAELIEAQRKAHDAMLLADWNVPSLCSARKHAAYLASAAVLSRIGGAES